MGIVGDSYGSLWQRLPMCFSRNGLLKQMAKSVCLPYQTKKQKLLQISIGITGCVDVELRSRWKFWSRYAQKNVQPVRDKENTNDAAASTI